MANNILSIKQTLSSDPWFFYFLVACGVATLIAVIVGFVRGIRRVKLTGLAWILSAVAYFVVHQLLIDKIPVKDLLQGIVSKHDLPFATSLCVALISVLVIGLLYGLFALILRPRKEKKKKTERRLRVNEIGMRYDDDYDYESGFYDNRNLRVKPMRKKVSFFGRVFGALACTANALTIVATIFIVVLFVVGSLSSVLPTAYVSSEKLTPYLHKYGMDFIIIGILFAFMRKGTRVGFIEAIRTLVVKFGGTVSLILGVYLPFSPFISSVPFAGALTVRCQNLFKSFGAGATAQYIIGGILAGIVLAVIIFFALWLVNFLLRKLGDLFHAIMPIKALDCGLSALVYIAYGLAVVALILFGLYLLIGFEPIFANMDGILRDGELSGGIFELFDYYVKDYVILAIEKIKGFFTTVFGYFA